MKKIFSRIFCGLTLFLFYGAAIADNMSPRITSDAVANHTDISIAYLAQVFGTVGNVLQGTSGQMLGQLFYKLNIGILVVVGIWLGYTAITVVLRSAQEGSFMGQNKNIAIVLLKIALGVGMLMPNPATGYSIFQDVVMKVVVEGVALADQTWSYGLNYINAGGSLWHTPLNDSNTDNSLDSDAVSKLLGTGVTSNLTITKNWTSYGVIQQVFADEACMYASNISSANNAPPAKNDNSIYNNTPPTERYNVVVNDNNNSFDFPGVGNSSNSGTNCGSISWSSIAGANCDNVSVGEGAQNTCQFAKNAVQEIVYTLMPAAKDYVCSQPGAQNSPACSVNSSSTDASRTTMQAFFTSLINFANNVIPIEQSQQAGISAGARGFIANAKEQGWMTAGRYYWDLSQIQASYHHWSGLQTYAPTVTAPGVAYTNHTTVSNIVNNAAFDSGVAVIWAQTELANYSNASSKGETFNYGNQEAMGGIIADLLMPIIAPIVRMVALFALPPTDPILFLHLLGMNSLGLAGSIWFGFATIVLVALGITVVCQGSLNLSTPIGGVIDWLKVPLMAIATMFLMVGVTLGYYLPLYPYMLFTFGVIGWIIAVIEAMVAAPLVCLGLTHPEGHDFLGEAKQALMLLLGIFLRPVLMVIGLIAGMIMSYVAFKILIYTYSHFLMDLMYAIVPSQSKSVGVDVLAGALIAWANFTASSGGIANGVMAFLISIPLFLVVFAAIVYVVTNQCYSLIFALPDNIMRWIGAPTTQSAAQQMAQQVQGVVSTAAQTSGEKFSQATSEGVEKTERGTKTLKLNQN